ncbi:MAG: XRE family transcriptional regulator [Deltaproteobacteria bacterium HGW-Deltaproteobacteria-19]|jgi:transcriptional regulator with XRE-family HTH domain|nr:MAG: XRE family transcriptional regulator [Deltaproteobacteria bacterium HGW-Deltaproteobacteria-19]
MGSSLTIEDAFGQTVKELRRVHKMSQETLAEKSNLDRSFISLLECGKKQPSLVTIFQLAKALKVSPSKIISLTEEKQKSSDPS